MKFIAPAKINLFLHIHGRRDDGYHVLNSLFVFTQWGDEITLTPAETLSITIDGPFHEALSSDLTNNLIVRAAELLKTRYAVSTGAHIHLTKNIPVCAGLGGGSSDAATAMIGLNQLWQLGLEKSVLAQISLSLGADIPACVDRMPLMVSGIGEKTERCVIPREALYVVLVNPQLSLSTRDVFWRYDETIHFLLNKKLLTSTDIPKDFSHFIQFLSHQRNDLESIAIQLLPEIQEILNALSKQQHCLLARMSGSGPTCFGIFSDALSAAKSVDTLRTIFPHYWIMQSVI